MWLVGVGGESHSIRNAAKMAEHRPPYFPPQGGRTGEGRQRTNGRGKADLKWGPEKGDPDGHSHLFFSQV